MGNAVAWLVDRYSAAESAADCCKGYAPRFQLLGGGAATTGASDDSPWTGVEASGSPSGGLGAPMEEGARSEDSEASSWSR